MYSLWRKISSISEQRAYITNGLMESTATTAWRILRVFRLILKCDYTLVFLLAIWAILHSSGCSLLRYLQRKKEPSEYEALMTNTLFVSINSVKHSGFHTALNKAFPGIRLTVGKERETCMRYLSPYGFHTFIFIAIVPNPSNEVMWKPFFSVYTVVAENP